MSYTNGRYECSHDYKAKLLGILPTGFKYTDNSGPWQTENIKVCKKPSEQTQKGQIDYAGHPTLVGSAIVERKHQISECISIDIDDSESSTSCGDEDNHEIGADSTTQCDDMPKVNGEECDVITTRNKRKTDQVNGNNGGDTTESTVIDGKDNNKNEPAPTLAVTNFFQNCFDSRSNPVPDFICERLVAIFLASDTDSFVLQARKINLPSKTIPEVQQETIELRFVPNSVKAFSFVDAGWVGPVFANWALSDTNEDLTTTVNLSMRNAKISEGDDSDSNHKECSDEEEEWSLFVHHHHAFIQGELSRINHKNNQARKFNLLMSALIGGVWRLEENPENYTCGHLCEMRTAQENTVSPYTATGKKNSFYKRVRMRRNWLQAHLAGEKHYLVGINGRSGNGDLYSRVIKELWLYDVQKIPRAIEISAADENFLPWTPDQLQGKLFDALQVIYERMKNAKPDEIFTFIQYNDCDTLVYDPDKSLHAQYLEMKKKIVISGLPAPSPDIEDKNQYDQQLLLTVLKCVGYPQDSALPELERISRDLELTFTSHSLASSFMEVVKGYWSKRKNIPPGFEKLWIQQKSITLPLDHPLHQSRRQFQHSQRFQRSPSDYYHHGEGNRYFQRPPIVARQRSLSDCDDNWRR